MDIDVDAFMRRGAISQICRVYQLPSVRCIVVRGWRSRSIDHTLDLCANVNGYVTQDTWEPRRRFDDAGSKLYTQPADYKLAWARRNRDASLENSKQQWKKTEAIMRREYKECTALFASIYPDVKVVGFDTWRRQFRKTWNTDRLQCLAAISTWRLNTAKVF